MERGGVREVQRLKDGMAWLLVHGMMREGARWLGCLRGVLFLYIISPLNGGVV